MHFLIVPMRRQGVALEQRTLRAATPVLGDIVIAHEYPDFLGRSSDVASVRPEAAGRATSLPALYDARLAWMGTGGLVLTGIERDGPAVYALAWWCRPHGAGLV